MDLKGMCETHKMQGMIIYDRNTAASRSYHDVPVMATEAEPNKVNKCLDYTAMYYASEKRAQYWHKKCEEYHREKPIVKLSKQLDDKRRQVKNLNKKVKRLETQNKALKKELKAEKKKKQQ
jgi:hypothetical protein